MGYCFDPRRPSLIGRQYGLGCRDRTEAAGDTSGAYSFCGCLYGIYPGFVNDEMRAHAWLRSGKFYLVGGRGQDEYIVAATFADGI